MRFLLMKTVGEEILSIFWSNLSEADKNEVKTNEKKCKMCNISKANKNKMRTNERECKII